MNLYSGCASATVDAHVNKGIIMSGITYRNTYLHTFHYEVSWASDVCIGEKFTLKMILTLFPHRFGAKPWGSLHLYT